MKFESLDQPRGTLGNAIDLQQALFLRDREVQREREEINEHLVAQRGIGKDAQIRLVLLARESPNALQERRLGGVGEAEIPFGERTPFHRGGAVRSIEVLLAGHELAHSLEKNV